MLPVFNLLQMILHLAELSIVSEGRQARDDELPVSAQRRGLVCYDGRRLRSLRRAPQRLCVRFLCRNRSVCVCVFLSSLAGTDEITPEYRE